MPRQSLRRRLPLLITALLCVVVGTFGWLAHRQVEAALLGATSTRLASVTRELAGMLAQDVPPTLANARALADAPALARLAARPDDGDAREAALRLLERVARDRANGVTLTLWGADGGRLLAVGPLAPVALPPAPAPPPLQAPGRHGAWVGPLERTGDEVTYQVVAPLLGAPGDTLALLAAHRRVVGDGVDRVRALIGSDAALLVGNAAGDGWTDLAGPAAGPATPPAPGELVRLAAPDGEPLLGMATPIPLTPWVVWVQLPRRAALQPARDLVLDVALVALVVVLLGTGGAWMLSERVTAPLVEVTGAARAVARGDYARRVPVRRRADELGSLALSFNSMATQVEAASRELRAHAYDLEEANAELRESEQRYRRLVELSPDAILVHRDGRILFANPAAVALVGAASPEELADRSMLDIVPPEDHDDYEERWNAAQGPEWCMPLAERRVQRLDGRVASVEVASTPLVLDGEPAALTILRDVTERKRLEERFLHAQKMEAVGQLAGGVAHDFNNLLTVITSYAGLLLTELPAADAARADVQEIADAARRAATLTRQLLAFSRQQVLRPQVVEPNRVVADMERMLRRLIREDIELVTRLDPALGRVSVDPGQLEQVIMNLAVNARDAMPDGGRLVVRTRNAHVDEREAALHAGAAPGPYVVLAVVDTGSGMSDETARRIFEPFFTTKEPGRGTGLGLSTVYGIVRQSGGHVRVESEPGLGSIFEVYLPRVDAPADAHPAGGALHLAGARGAETVLLAEDEAPVRAATRRILERAGYRVLEAGSGAEALALARARAARIDLLLTDMVMPEMSGRELAAHLRETHPGVRTVFMSGYMEDTVVREGVLDAGDGFVQKPFTPQSLTLALREALAGGGVGA